MELGGTDYLVACWDNGTNYEVSVWDSTGSHWEDSNSIKDDLTDGYKAQFAKFSVNDAEDMIFCNGKDKPQRWVGTIGTASSDLGLGAPSVGSLTTANTATPDKKGIDYNGTYYYKFTTFWDSSGANTKYGESGPSNSGNIAITGADIGDNITVSAEIDSCPSVPSGATKNNVYRSPAGESNGPYEYVGYYSSGTTFTDNMPEGEKGAAIPADAGTPPRLKNILVHRGRIYGVGLNSSGQLTNKGVWSNSGQPDMFPAANYAYFPDPLIGPVAFKENVYWITEKQIYVTPNGDVDTYPKPLKICDKGCTSFGSIVDVGNGIIFQSDDNIYWADFNSYNEKDGDFPFPVGEPIKDKIDGIPSNYRHNSTACFYNGRYYISLTGSNQTTNTATLCWDVTIGLGLLKQGLYGGWGSPDWAANDLHVHDGTLYSADNTNKYIMEHDFAGAADYHTKTEYDAATSYNLITELKTKHYLFTVSPILFRSILLESVGTGASYTAFVSFDYDSFTKTQTFTLGSDTLATDSNWLIWGQGTWGNFNWGSPGGAPRSSHKKMASGCKGRSAQLTLGCSDSQDTNLTELTFFYKLLPRRLGS